MELADLVTSLPRGKAVAEHFRVRTVEDLLRVLPGRYVQRGELTDLGRLERGAEVTVMARIVSATDKPYWDRNGKRQHRQEVVVSDGHRRLTLVFFRQGHRLTTDLAVDRVAMFAGTVSEFNGVTQLVHPEVEPIEGARTLVDRTDAAPDDPDRLLGFAGELRPVYPTHKNVRSWELQRLIGFVLDTLGDDAEDPLPPALRAEHRLVTLMTAFRKVHRPRDYGDVTVAHARLKWDEAFALQTVLARRRHALSALPATPRADRDDGARAAFDARLPFTLTQGQVEVGATIAAELARSHPMHRLLQGEVGSGKTLVALRAMLTVVDAGGQAALLAPTEVLAQQHHRSITAMLGDLAERGMIGGSDVGTTVVLLTGSTPAAVRRRALLDLGVGDAGIVIGTHALLEDRVQFFDLGLVVVDEQHRFGVEQRAALAEKSRDGTRPHVLVMTATPIPRTVAMTVFGDLETSTLAELPPGRSTIVTHVVPAAQKPHYLERAWQRVRDEVAAGRQAYVVCPRIGDEQDEPPAKGAAAEQPRSGVLETARALVAGELAGLRVEVLHGRMGPDEKDRVIRDFGSGAVDVLVATTVVEVGVDVPNATVMVVMDAEGFGVSQLHQIRGRIGRGAHGGLCLLVTTTAEGSAARDRLDAVAATTDGFALSRLDLAQRREGDVLGAKQSGAGSSLRALDVLTDEELIAQARRFATAAVEQDPELVALPALRRVVDHLEFSSETEFLDKS